MHLLCPCEHHTHAPAVPVRPVQGVWAPGAPNNNIGNEQYLVMSGLGGVGVDDTTDPPNNIAYICEADVICPDGFVCQWTSGVRVREGVCVCTWGSAWGAGGGGNVRVPKLLWVGIGGHVLGLGAPPSTPPPRVASPCSHWELWK
jgi:hypothetical protein